MIDTRFSKFVLLVNGLVPLALMLWDLFHKRVGANPLEFVTRTTGMLTLVFLVLTLAISPVRHTTRLNWLVKFRRMLGLFAFFYGFLHLATYLAFDRYLKIGTVPGDVAQRPFIALGMLAFFLMAPLAITSTNKMVKRLGGTRWSKLHRLVYAAGVAGVLHFWLLVKSDIRLPLTFAFIMALLLAHRLLVRFYPAEQTATNTLFPQESSPRK